VAASPLLTASFVAVTLAVAVALIAAARLAARRAGSAPDRHTRVAAIGIGLWLAITGAIAATGALRDFSAPPKLLLLIAGCAALTIAFAASRHGETLARHLPLGVLVGINAFRLPLELVMHRAYTEGVMPVQMSFSGRNWDVFTGIAATALGLWSLRRPVGFRLARIFNIAGFALLANVVVISILSTPVSFRVFENDPPNVWIAELPFVWLPTFLVQTAFLSHLLILRRLVFELGQRQRPKPD
jgi:hypothetical protein